MDTAIALENYIKLKTLPEGCKLRLCGEGRLEFETRWLSSGRRYWEQTSRKDIIQPIRDTFVTVFNTCPDDFETILNQTEKRLQFLYPSDPDFKSLFDDIRSTLNEPSILNETAFVVPTTIEAKTVQTPITEASVRRRHVNENNTKGDVIIDFGDSSDEDINHSGCALIDDFLTWFRNCCKTNDDQR